MKKVRWLSAAAGTALVAATFALPGAGVAYASGNGNITGNGNLSLLSGNTVNAPIRANPPGHGKSAVVAPSSTAATKAQNVRTGRMIRLRRVAFLLPSALSKSLDSSQSPYSAWSVRIRRAASRASRDVPRGRYTTR